MGEKGTHPHNDSDLGDQVGVHGLRRSREDFTVWATDKESDTEQEREIA